MMSTELLIFHPAVPYVLGLPGIFLAPPRLRKFLQLALPFMSFWCLEQLPKGTPLELPLLGFPLRPLFLDALSYLFALTFLFFSLAANIYALHVENRLIPLAANAYVGSSLGAVLAGDWISLFLFWEMMAIASAFLVWNKDEYSAGAVLRYLLVHLTGGLFFFSGLILHLSQGGDVALEPLEMNRAGLLIFLGFAINAAVPPLHAWLPDAYPASPPAGGVYLSAYTTKVAVYAFARIFPGNEFLILVGAAMAVYGIIYALMENEIRRLLSYHIICQVGYMLAGIGLGTAMGMNAGTGHAIGNILFKGLLFMATGAVMEATGKSRLEDLGGLWHKIPWVVFFYFVGALAISGVPFLNGYITKAMLVDAATQEHRQWLELILVWVAAGTFLSIACKLAYFAFWGHHERVTTTRPLPANSYVAMAFTAGACLWIGGYPKPFLSLMPYPISFQPFTPPHLIHTLQLLLGTLLTFFLLLPRLHPHPAITLDTDWFYRKGAKLFASSFCLFLKQGQEAIQNLLSQIILVLGKRFDRLSHAQGVVGIGKPLLWVVLAFSLTGWLLLFLN